MDVEEFEARLSGWTPLFASFGIKRGTFEDDKHQFRKDGGLQQEVEVVAPMAVC